MDCALKSFSFFFFNDTATTEIYTLSLHDALPIFPLPHRGGFGHGFSIARKGHGVFTASARLPCQLAGVCDYPLTSIFGAVIELRLGLARVCLRLRDRWLCGGLLALVGRRR